jgi:hypothetical protein
MRSRRSSGRRDGKVRGAGDGPTARSIMWASRGPRPPRVEIAGHGHDVGRFRLLLENRPQQFGLCDALRAPQAEMYRHEAHDVVVVKDPDIDSAARLHTGPREVMPMDVDNRQPAENRIAVILPGRAESRPGNCRCFEAVGHHIERFERLAEPM